MDAVRAYQSGALRACVISIWVAVALDLTAKIRELADGGDGAAVAWTAAMDQAITNDAIARLGKIEQELLDVCRDTFQFGYDQDPEPHWYYALDQVARDLLVTHGDVPLLAAADLIRGASSLLWCPELEITDDTGSAEIDICTMVDGRIVIGEAKSNNSLRGDKGTEDVAKGSHTPRSS